MILLDCMRVLNACCSLFCLVVETCILRLGSINSWWWPRIIMRILPRCWLDVFLWKLLIKIVLRHTLRRSSLWLSTHIMAIDYRTPLHLRGILSFNILALWRLLSSSRRVLIENSIRRLYWAWVPVWSILRNFILNFFVWVQISSAPAVFGFDSLNFILTHPVINWFFLILKGLTVIVMIGNIICSKLMYALIVIDDMHILVRSQINIHKVIKFFLFFTPLPSWERKIRI